jgi:hypothetical protein
MSNTTSRTHSGIVLRFFNINSTSFCTAATQVDTDAAPSSDYPFSTSWLAIGH